MMEVHGTIEKVLMSCVQMVIQIKGSNRSDNHTTRGRNFKEGLLFSVSRAQKTGIHSGKRKIQILF